VEDSIVEYDLRPGERLHRTDIARIVQAKEPAEKARKKAATDRRPNDPDLS
jgi:hypothetical protein